MNPDLREGYRRCALLTRASGTTYYWGTRILPPQQRRDVHAIYALCRMADDIVDAPGATEPARLTATGAALRSLRERFERALSGESAGAILDAVAHTVRARRIDPACFDRFFAAMAADLTVREYRSYEQLSGYMDGSAAVIGEMMLPILQPTSDRALGPARDLGLAFQLTNFIRDFAEDARLGRTYLPTEELQRFDVPPGIRSVTPQWRAFAAFQIERNRALYASADEGLAYLPARSADCVLTARRLYSRILDRIEAAGYDVFTARVRVPTGAKIALSADSVIRRWMTQRRRQSPIGPADRADPTHLA